MQPTRTAPDRGRGELPVLSVRNLKTHFKLDEGVVRAVDGVSFDLHAGEVVGIVGESGCGKSITMKSVLRLIQKPGRIVDGEIIYRRPPEAQHGAKKGRELETDLAKLPAQGRRMRQIRGGDIALIPQEPMASFSPLHSIGEQIVEAIRLHNPVSKAEAREIAIGKLREVGMPSPEQRFDSYSWQLSGGLRQRAIIAMALSCNPSVLIADEPTTAIDVTTQAQVLELLKELQREHGSSILFITHDLGVIAQVADYVVVMYLGRVAEQGPVHDIFHEARHPYTRALLQSVPSLHAEARIALPTVAGSIPHPLHRPPGCPFHPRCPDFMPGKCDVHMPALVAVDGGSPVACFLHHDQVEGT
ncbi:MAG TPA: ABC transporter ATP-binding protein [Trueperaceae bacterium]|nr:ABC transporter ATP-binding protein [Trueperaceae bacterium]